MVENSALSTNTQIRNLAITPYSQFCIKIIKSYVVTESFDLVLPIDSQELNGKFH